MRLNRVVLENFGLYRGRNEIELIPRKDGQCSRPIILIGGMNGAGKTTFLNGIRLAFYGKAAFGDRVSEKRYQDQLLALIHRLPASESQPEYARVGVEFDYVFSGQLETYYVQRSWTAKNGSGAHELLQVHKRASSSQGSYYDSWPILDTLQPEHWQAFISDIVPRRLSQLFFFDGEKIKRIADDISGDAAIAEAIRSLLGLDIVGRLKADLDILATREAKQYITQEEASTLVHLELEIRTIEARLEELSQNRAGIETSLRSIGAEIKRLENRLQEQGGAFVQDRPNRKTRQVALEAMIQNIKKQIRQECEGIFPLALCPSNASQLVRQIEAENQLRRSVLLNRHFTQVCDEFLQSLSSSSVLRDPKIKKEAVRIFQDTIAKHVSKSAISGHEQDLLGLSEADAASILNWIKEASQEASDTMCRLCKELDTCERELHEIRRQLMMTPEEAVLAPVFGDIGAQNQLFGQKEAELRAVDEELASLRNKCSTKARERERLLMHGREKADAKDRLDMISRVQKSLDKYLERLTRMKMEALRQTVTRCFNMLSRKKDQLHDISIDALTFEVSLHDKTGHTIPRMELSAGEKQILAIAILWGLAKSCGRPLPIIIDTPLGRLDSDHRKNLINNYFPNAGHQVILLSTDTEVDKRLFAELKTYISHCYHLVYDDVERMTLPRKEYFWKENSHA